MSQAAPQQPSQGRRLPKRTLIVSVGLLVLSLVCRWFLGRAQRACERVSDQCADAGFAWEAVAALAFASAAIATLIALFLVVLRLLRPLGPRFKPWS